MLHLSVGRPEGARASARGIGVAQIVECVWQLTGRASGRQVEGRRALAHSIGELATNHWVTILEAT